MSKVLPISTYLPHQAPMILLDRVISVSETDAHCQVTIDRQGVLGPFLSAQHTLATWFGIELIAQTIGTWSGWHNQQQGKKKMGVGLLLGARAFHAQMAEFPAGSLLDIYSTLLMQDEKFGSFEGKIQINGITHITARLNTYLPDSNDLAVLFDQKDITP